MTKCFGFRNSDFGFTPERRLMGKIRIKTLGDEEQEKEQQKKTKKRKEARSAGHSTVSSDEGEAIFSDEITAPPTAPRNDKEKTKKAEGTKRNRRTKKEKFKKSKRARSNKYNEVKMKVDINKKYSLKDALALLPELHIATFDETVELHVNTEEPGASGTVTLPHGTGKKLRIAIVTDELIKELEKSLPANASPSNDGRRGKIDFDILLSVPTFMPKLAKLAKVLGPKGLMPNPKNGTVTQNPEETAKKFEGGHMSYKTEAKVPIIHLSVGKMSFGQEKLMENIKVIFASLKNAKVKQVVLKSTMSPGIKVEYTS